MGQTPLYLIPYPDLDAVADIPSDMRVMAERIDAVVQQAVAKATADAVARIPRMAQGTGAVAFTADQYMSATVKYPAGVFTATPRIFITSLHSAFAASASSNSLTACNVWLRHIDAAKVTMSVSFYWLAVQA